jgi:signal transduction histidine kinase
MKTTSWFIVKEKAEKTSQARAADFLSTVSHELRTPLNAINGGYPFVTGREAQRFTTAPSISSLKFSGNY